MQIQLDDTYSIEHDSRQWILTTKTGVVQSYIKDGVEQRKNVGEPVYSRRFYANLNQVAKTILLDGLNTSSVNSVEALQVHLTKCTDILANSLQAAVEANKHLNTSE